MAFLFIMADDHFGKVFKIFPEQSISCLCNRLLDATTVSIAYNKINVEIENNLIFYFLSKFYEDALAIKAIYRFRSL